MAITLVPIGPGLPPAVMAVPERARILERHFPLVSYHRSVMLPRNNWAESRWRLSTSTW